MGSGIPDSYNAVFAGSGEARITVGTSKGAQCTYPAEVAFQCRLLQVGGMPYTYGAVSSSCGEAGLAVGSGIRTQCFNSGGASIERGGFDTSTIASLVLTLNTEVWLRGQLGVPMPNQFGGADAPSEAGATQAVA
jgi:hypothetical protein